VLSQTFSPYMGWGTASLYVPARIWECDLVLEVQLSKGESQDSLLRRFQRMVQVSGILREAKARRRFVSKRDAARIKAKNSARRRRQDNARAR